MALQITPKELLYHRKNFYESLKVHGIPCRIYSLTDSQKMAYDFYKDIKENSSNHVAYVDSYLTYEEVPKIKTLKSLGWYTEDQSTLPIIGYIPVLYLDRDGGYSSFSPRYEDKITIQVNTFDDNVSTRSFLIKDFTANGFPNVVYYTVKLVPHRTDK